jgi:hypothetical protein
MAQALFSIAVEAARGIAGELRASGQTAALTSIVFSVISLEAFLKAARPFQCARKLPAHVWPQPLELKAVTPIPAALVCLEILSHVILTN